MDAYFDHSRAGLLVLQFTEPLSNEVESLDKLAPTDGPGTEVLIVQHSADDLFTAMHEAWTVWPKANRDLLLSVSVDPKANGLTLEVAKEASDLAVRIADQLEGNFGMEVGIELVLPNDEVVCTSRTNCHTPLRGGVEITAVVSSITRRCTMGFHVRVSGDDQFVTAGHCGHNAAAATWRHAGLGNIGVRTATQYQQNGRDIMRVQMSNSQDSSLLYSSATAVTADLDPYLGEPVCAYKGVGTPVVQCAAITDNVTSWTGAECGCTINGGDTSLSGVLGDSGAPIVDQNSRWVAIGLLNGSNGLFARLDDALNQWGAVIRTP